jgi:two-component system NarL family sensor kinase
MIVANVLFACLIPFCQVDLQKSLCLIILFLLNNTALIIILLVAKRRNQQRMNEKAVQLLKFQEGEKERISYTLHDSIGQYVTGLKWGLSQVKRKLPPADQPEVDKLLETCEDVIFELRAISQDLIPSMIKDFGCFPAIRDYLEKQKSIVPFQIEYDMSPEMSKIVFSKEFSINLFRMVQEIIQNALKHSDATHLKLHFGVTPTQLEIVFTDNGKGMSQKKPLSSLSYRTQLFSGSMQDLNLSKGLGFKILFLLRKISNG